MRIRGLTNSDCLPPIDVAHHVVQGLLPPSRGHLPRRESKSIGDRPIALDALAVCTAHSRHIVKGVTALALSTMRHKMKLWNCPPQSFVSEVKVETLGILVHPPKEIDGIRARDVVRDIERQDLRIGEAKRRNKNEIHVAMTTSKDMSAKTSVKEQISVHTVPRAVNHQLRVRGSNSAESTPLRRHH